MARERELKRVAVCVKDADGAVGTGGRQKLAFGVER